MICPPCGQGRHNGCRWPTSCPCHHRDPAAELVAETAANDRVDRARILAGGSAASDPDIPDLTGRVRWWTGPITGYMLAPQTGPLVPRIVDHHVA